MTHVDYRNLSLHEVVVGIHDVAEEARMTFGALDQRQLNWKPDAQRWSIGQCFEHLITSNRMMREGATHALSNPPASVWQKWRWWSGIWGKEMIRTQGPVVGRKFKSPGKSTPPSQVPEDIIARFVDQHRDLEAWAKSLTDQRANEAIMVSPFVKIVTYSVMDAFRLLVAHDRRHFEQARRVLMELPQK